MIGERFLSILKAALCGTPLDSLEEFSSQEWEQILSMAEAHKVLPLVYEAIYSAPAVRDGDGASFLRSKRMVRYQVMTQALKTEEFLQLNERLQEAEITPLVVKGIVCRQLYPLPDHRTSSDEDVLIPPEQFERCHEVMESFGLHTDLTREQRETAYEVPYRKADSPLFIELHKHLFPPESEAYGDLNRFFDGVFDRAVRETIAGRTVYTFGYTDHLFYLICHAFKHFLHSGFGIRQVCDIVMYAGAYGDRIDWQTVYQNCCEIRAEIFTAALFRIGSKYLAFDEEKAHYPQCFREIVVDESAMLQDLLSAGIYGGATLSRKHSSNMTLEAVSADKKGKRPAGSVLGSLFPPAKKLEGRYPYLAKHPWMLPVAWADRILKYRKETKTTSGSDALEAVRIGNERVELLRKYGVIR